MERPAIRIRFRRPETIHDHYELAIMHDRSGWSPGKPYTIVGDRLKSRVILGRGICSVKREQPGPWVTKHRGTAKQNHAASIYDSLLTGCFASLR